MRVTVKLNVQIVRGEPREPGSRRRRLIIAAALAAALAAPLAYAATRNDVFTDVPSTAADHDAINRVYEAGIMKPCSTSPMKFCPNDPVIRRGAAAQLDRALDLSEGSSAVNAKFLSVKGSYGEFGVGDINGLSTSTLSVSDYADVGVEIVEKVSATNSENKYAEAQCPTPKHLIGGGAWVEGVTTNVAVVRSAPLSPNTAFTVWKAEAEEMNGTSTNWTLHAYAICARVR